MMEFKPRNGFNSGGYTDPKKTKNKNLIGAVIFLIGLFSLTALAFGWWSILVDAGIIGYFSWFGPKSDKQKEA